MKRDVYQRECSKLSATLEQSGQRSHRICDTSALGSTARGDSVCCPPVWTATGQPEPMIFKSAARWLRHSWKVTSMYWHRDRTLQWSSSTSCRQSPPRPWAAHSPPPSPPAGANTAPLRKRPIAREIYPGFWVNLYGLTFWLLVWFTGFFNRLLSVLGKC